MNTADLSEGAARVVDAFGEVPVLASIPTLNAITEALTDDLGIAVTSLVHCLAVTVRDTAREFGVSYREARDAVLSMVAFSADAYEHVAPAELALASDLSQEPDHAAV